MNVEGDTNNIAIPYAFVAAHFDAKHLFYISKHTCRFIFDRILWQKDVFLVILVERLLDIFFSYLLLICFCFFLFFLSTYSSQPEVSKYCSDLMPLLLGYLSSLKQAKIGHVTKAFYALENFLENLGKLTFWNLITCPLQEKIKVIDIIFFDLYMKFSKIKLLSRFVFIKIGSHAVIPKYP